MGQEVKIALCLSGHARTYNKTYQFWYENLLSKYDVDVFMSLWDTIGPRSFGEGRSEYAPLPRTDFNSGILDSEKIDVNDITRMWKPQLIEIEWYHGCHNQFIKDIWKILDERNRRNIPEGFEHHHPLSVRSMMYKRYKCNELKISREVLTGVEYDMVIQSRPDVALTKELSNLDASLIFHNCRSNVPNELADFGVIGSSRGINDWCGLYKNVDWLFNSMKHHDDFFQFLNPHKMYFNYLSQLGITFKEADLGMSIVRDTGIILGHLHDQHEIKRVLGI